MPTGRENIVPEHNLVCMVFAICVFTHFRPVLRLSRKESFI